MFKWTILFVTLALTACAQPVEFKEAQVKVGATSLKVQIADTIPALEQGLMNRKSVAPWDGMIFIFPQAQQVAFWMKNTLIPLDVGYFDEAGILREIHAMKPQDLTPIRSTVVVKYALELPQGDFEKRGLKIGQKLILKD